jgi:hypothetical protein
MLHAHSSGTVTTVQIVADVPSREEILKPTICNDSLHEISKGNGVRILDMEKFTTLSHKYIVAKL